MMDLEKQNSVEKNAVSYEKEFCRVYRWGLEDLLLPPQRIRPLFPTPSFWRLVSSRSKVQGTKAWCLNSISHV